MAAFVHVGTLTAVASYTTLLDSTHVQVWTSVTGYTIVLVLAVTLALWV